MPEIIDLRLTAMAHGGSALGRARLSSAVSGSGPGKGRPGQRGEQVVFVPYGIPGETVRAEITKAHPRWAQAELLEVLEPSVHRVEPPCSYYGPGKCGGCHFQHIEYEAQTEFKRQVVQDQLGRLGGLRDVTVRETIGAALPWGYRNHAQFHIATDGHLGFLTADTHRVVPVRECLILEPQLNDLLAALDMEWPELHRLSLRCGSATGDLMAIFELDHYEDFDIEVDFPVSCVLLLADGEAVVLIGTDHLTEHVGGRDFRVSGGSFFQVNTGGAEALVELVRQGLAPNGNETLVDLYCGVGLFGLALADGVGQVIGVEADRSACSDFGENAQGLEHVRLIQGTAEQSLPGLDVGVDLVVLDPPRSGAGKDVVAEIAKLGPRRVAYVSCDPATLARDARAFTGKGYLLLEVQPVDLFPQTFHVESVAFFERQD